MALIFFLLIFFAELSENNSMEMFRYLRAQSGESVTVPCFYDLEYKHHVKYWCKGFTRSSCTVMARSDSTQAEGKMSVTDDPAHLVILVTMRDLQVKDTDWYWCGAEISGAVDDSACLYLNVVSGKMMIHFYDFMTNISDFLKPQST
uniref:Immunoglobulin domain-containing protein n=1 Tax=Scleropages formosus TaxID=113540 RepID=A0A8C9UXP9_SCLFO